jgi:hypothetical protein
MSKEAWRLLGFQQRDGVMVALMEEPWDGGTHAIDRATMETRQQNLIKNGAPHDETDRALAQWPATMREWP